MLVVQIDLRKMPLGKLSRRQITDAMKVLSELQLLVQNGERLNSPKMVDASNRFFTLIPHDFGVNAPPLLNQLTVIKVSTSLGRVEIECQMDVLQEKLEMLDNLLEIEVAFNILRGENRQSDRDPVDQVGTLHFSASPSSQIANGDCRTATVCGS